MKSIYNKQVLPISLDQAWAFFSNPANLNEITPPDFSFEIRSELPNNMYEGMFISYKITPLLSIKMEWVTEITVIKDREYFIDEQRKGPYNIWHHEHHFKEIEGGVEMIDLLYYDIGWGILGNIAGFLFVDKKVKDIFDYRRAKLTSFFN